jgi:hypothetical protein
MSISLVIKITSMAREGSLCLHIPNSGEGLLRIIFFLVWFIIFDWLVMTKILVSVYSYCWVLYSGKKHGFQIPSSLWSDSRGNNLVCFMFTDFTVKMVLPLHCHVSDVCSSLKSSFAPRVYHVTFILIWSLIKEST